MSQLIQLVTVESRLRSPVRVVALARDDDLVVFSVVRGAPPGRVQAAMNDPLLICC